VRVAVLDTVYPAFVKTLYGSNPTLAKQPYDVQLQTILDYSFGTSDAYTEGLRKAGHESWNLLTNVLPLQLAWLRRHRLRSVLRLTEALPGPLEHPSQNLVMQRITAAQVDALDPDVVFVHDTGSITARLLRRWRKQGRFVVGQIASPMQPMKHYANVDLMLSSFHHFVDRFRAAGVDAEFFRLAFHEKILDRLRTRGIEPAPDSARRHDVVFIGGVNPATHGRGTQLLESAAARLPLDIWGYGSELLDAQSPIRARWQGEAWGIEMYRILATAKIVLNRHIDVAEGQANNMRLYEATGSGAVLLTDAARGLADLFDVDREVLAYDDSDDLVAKARHLLEDEDARVRIAAAGQQRTLHEHTYVHRMAELSRMLEQRVR
jgi:spore maturation protein CgeB